jgi:hypothetical protein
MELLGEIDSPIPRPLRVAGEVALSARLRDVTRRTRAGELDFEAAEPEITRIVELARRLGARLQTAAVRRDVEAVALERIAALRDGRGAGEGAAGLSALLGLQVDLWEAQNRFWDWAGSSRITLARDAMGELATHLWFDARTILRRAGLGAVDR